MLSSDTHSLLKWRTISPTWISWKGSASFFSVLAESVEAGCASGITVLVCVEADDSGWEITDEESILFLFSGSASR